MKRNFSDVIRGITEEDRDYLNGLFDDLDNQVNKLLEENRKLRETNNLEIEKLKLELRDKRVDRKFEIIKFCTTTGLTLFTTIVGWSIYSRQFNKGLKFEESGSFTSLTMKDHISNRFKLLKH